MGNDLLVGKMIRGTSTPKVPCVFDQTPTARVLMLVGGRAIACCPGCWKLIQQVERADPRLEVDGL